jgi:nitrous oxide reductase
LLQGKAKKINGHNVLMMETAIKEGILFLVPEPKSPHGVDVTPDGKFLTVAGKLDTHVSVYSFEKIQAAIKAGKFESKDPYGIPVIGMKDALHTQVQLGLGPCTPSTTKQVYCLHLALCRLASRQVELTVKARCSTRSRCTTTSVT